MSTPFAEAQALAGAAVAQLLANAVLTVGADTVAGHLNRHPMDIDGVRTQGPTFLCAAADLAALSVTGGTAVSIDGAAYTVRVRDDNVHSGQALLWLART